MSNTFIARQVIFYVLFFSMFVGMVLFYAMLEDPARFIQKWKDWVGQHYDWIAERATLGTMGLLYFILFLLWMGTFLMFQERSEQYEYLQKELKSEEARNTALCEALTHYDERFKTEEARYLAMVEELKQHREDYETSYAEYSAAIDEQKRLEEENRNYHLANIELRQRLDRAMMTNMSLRKDLDKFKRARRLQRRTRHALPLRNQEL
jgi:hypothetical protein